MQRGFRWVATSTPLEAESGPAAMSGGPYGPIAGHRIKENGDIVSRILLFFVLVWDFSNVKFRDIILT